MQSKLDQFVGERFTYKTLEYKVERVKLNLDKAIIITDRRTFVLTEKQLDDLMDNIKFIDVENFKKKSWVPTPEMIEVIEPVQEVENVPVKSDLVVQHEAVMVAEPSNAQKVSSKLMDVFEALMDEPTEELYKKAAAMVNMGNSIVNAELAHWRLLTLKK